MSGIAVRRLAARAAPAFAMMAAGPAMAHVAARGSASLPSASEEVFAAALPILLSAALYLVGMCRLRRREPGRMSRLPLRCAAFLAGLGVLAAALLSPLDRWAAELFSAHMVQHELLMLGAAPLLVLGRPLPLFVWAFPARARQIMGSFVRSSATRGVWSRLHAAGCAWLMHALALWLWHVPRFFNAAVTNRFVHDLQHLTFLATALLFWSALFEARRATHQGAGIVYLFTTTIHTGVLGALITLASQPWYADFLLPSARWQLTALEDQQLGGLIMWVPGSVVYVGVALMLFAKWITASDRGARDSASEHRADAGVRPIDGLSTGR